MPDIIVDLRTALAKIYERPCQCVRCSECRGLGNVLVGFRGGPPDYDDLDDLETCDQCNGGIVEVCQRCMEAEEIEEQITEEEERRSK